MTQNDSRMDPGPSNICQNMSGNSFKNSSSITFDYPWSSPKSPQRLPAITKNCKKHVNKMVNTWTPPPPMKA